MSWKDRHTWAGNGKNALDGEKPDLTCNEVRDNLVALQGDEVPLLKAEALRSHLARCDECREEALLLDLAVRSVTKLAAEENAVEAPAGLLERAMKHVLRAHGWSEDTGRVGEMMRAGELPSLEPVQSLLSPNDRDTVSSGGPSAIVIEKEEAGGTRILRKINVFFRPVRHPLVRLVAAAFFLFAAFTFAFPDIAEAVGSAQMKVMGRRLSEAIVRAADVVLTHFSI